MLAFQGRANRPTLGEALSASYRYMRCKECSRQGGHPCKRSHGGIDDDEDLDHEPAVDLVAKLRRRRNEACSLGRNPAPVTIVCSTRNGTTDVSDNLEYSANRLVVVEQPGGGFLVEIAPLAGGQTIRTMTYQSTRQAIAAAKRTIDDHPGRQARPALSVRPLGSRGLRTEPFRS
ncbi:hypothetical protein [Bradyrhizobium sp. USDA 4454]